MALTWFEKIVPSRIKTERRSRSIPEGLWIKCPACDAVLYRAELERNLNVCPKCTHHMRISARLRLQSFLDPGDQHEIGAQVQPEDPLKFKDSKRYKDRLAQAQKATGERDALIAVAGRLHGEAVVACAFEFQFLGGSMGSVVGERFRRAVDYCIEHRAGLVCFSATGGARMQEALLSLMQMAKTSAALARLARAGLPFISVMTDPTTGGVSASLAMLGDLNVAEPRALIGFAGPRVIQQTVRETLPEGFQRSEFLLDHGALDLIIDRRAMRDRLAALLRLLQRRPALAAKASSQESTSSAMPAGRTRWPSGCPFQQDLHPRTIDLGLERVRVVAERLGLLPPAGRTAIIGGTNGKGSTASFLAAIAQAHGERVGLFTSPHQWRDQELIALEARDVHCAPLCTAFEQIEAARGRESLTYFEFNTLAALLVFRSGDVDTTVLEVGLGGRLDATNIVDADVAVLCSVGLDHRDWLGDTLEAIGAEKAGIFRPGRPVILGSTQMPATVMSALQALGCTPLIAERDFSWRIYDDGCWDYHAAGVNYARLPPPALPGAIQYRNAAVAITAWSILRAARASEPAAVAAALRSVRLPGRLQFIPGEVEWVFDVAHNAAAAAVLAAELRARPITGRTFVVFGMLEDKEVDGVAAQLMPLADHWLLCTLDGPRGLTAAELQRRIGAVSAPTELVVDVAAATERAQVLARPGDRVLVCGSFHTVGPALQARQLY